eukprot:TRINITY_DN1841_c0_g1_i1.p1 TRINITY_DN1841_c0_g1~~TRINITY_DN1841_c0_g1_i1.p1  ORF type:complete len:784 (+),score=154.86 TRINITY_DN1841_c0_g1_i1:207-2558(+)
MKSIVFLVSLLLFCTVTLTQTPGLSTYPNVQVANVFWPLPNVGFILTTGGDVYRSGDEGFTWTLQTVSSVMPGLNTYVTDIVVDNANPYSIMFLTPTSYIWITENAGNASYTQVLVGTRIFQAYPHPRKAGLIMAIVDYNSNSQLADLWWSPDFGKVWSTTFSKRVYQVSWGQGYELGYNDIIYADCEGDIFGYTTDHGVTFHQLFSNTVGFVVTSNYMFVGTLDVKYSRLQVILYVSSEALDNTNTNPSTYFEAAFPFGNDLPNFGYTILDDSTGAAWIGVNHGSYSLSWGNLYTSGQEGLQFTLALPYVNQYQGVFDYMKVEGLEGIYFANNVSNYQQPVGTTPLIKTVFTYDNGGEWRYLTPPSSDYFGAPIICTGSCSLNLHSYSSWYQHDLGFFYSNPNAIGLIIATGNVGQYLDNEGNDVATYLSRDAGLSWTEIYPTRSIYEFGDHGGILVLADTDTPTNTVLYSLNEGATFTAFQFAPNAVSVTNIITETSGTGRKFQILARTAQNTPVVYGLDLSTLQIRQCVDADYETFTPSDGIENCILGRKQVYSRRQRYAECYNSRDTDHLINSTNCQCNFEDYECDFGFVPEYVSNPTNGDPSGRICAYNLNSPILPDPPANCPTGTTYLVSKGYRKIAGDTCTGGVSYIFDPVTKNCPAGTTGPTSKTWVGIIIALFIIVALGVGGFVAFKNEAVRSKLAELVDKVKGAGSGAKYSRVGIRPGSLANDEFGIGNEGEGDLEDESLNDEEGPKELGDNEITGQQQDNSFNPRNDSTFNI